MTKKTSEYTAFDNPYLAVPSIDGFEEISATFLGKGDGPLELEIGFGRGRFIRERAAVLPHGNICGIETKRKLVFLCASKAQKAGLSNLQVLHGDARRGVTQISPDGCLANVFVNFPDPWWKARHQKRMVITDELVEQVVRLLGPGGAFFVQTDVDFRANAYQRVILNHSALCPVGEKQGMVDANPFAARSSRERHCEELGLPVHRLLFQKK